MHLLKSKFKLGFPEHEAVLKEVVVSIESSTSRGFFRKQVGNLLTRKITVNSEKDINKNWGVKQKNMIKGYRHFLLKG